MRLHSFIFLALCLLLAASASAANPGAEAEIRKLVADGIVSLRNMDGEVIYEHKTTSGFVPASLQKILLSQLAIRFLGMDHRFRTPVFVDSRNRLVIQGKGDPFLVSEELKLMALRIRQTGRTEFAGLALDDSLFEDETIPGLSTSARPHDSLNGALIVNFNTVLVERTRQGKVLSGERQTPLTPISKKIGARLKRGGKKRVNLGNDFNRNLKYAHQVIAEIFSRNGLKIADRRFARAKVPPGSKPFYVHRNSRDLETVLRGLLEYSNNFVANQIMLVIGAEVYGYPTNLKKGLASLNRLVRQIYGFSERDVRLAEASGISRDNRVTLDAMLKVLRRFRSHADLLTPNGDALLKSGTLRGIYNYAGYFKSGDELRPFVIYTSSPKNHRDRILLLLERINRSVPPGKTF